MTLNLEILKAQVGVTRCSDWMCVDQAMINRFADATLDHQFIHVDEARAAETPFGGTVAHGFLTLSLLPTLMGLTAESPERDRGVMLNYGFDQVRFVHPVRSGSFVRAVSVILDLEEKRPGQFQQRMEVKVEIQNVRKPALAAVWLMQISL